MSDKVKSRLMIAGAAFCAALFLFSGAMLCREYLDQKQSAEAFDEVAGLVSYLVSDAARVLTMADYQVNAGTVW